MLWRRHERPRRQTHESKTDPSARLYKKSPGKEAKLAYLGHMVAENRYGLIGGAMTTTADGTAEPDAALLFEAGIESGARLGEELGSSAVGEEVEAELGPLDGGSGVADGAQTTGSLVALAECGTRHLGALGEWGEDGAAAVCRERKPSADEEIACRKNPVSNE